MRPSDAWGGEEEQKQFLVDLAQGKRAGEGGRPEWTERIQLVEGSRPGDPPVSSTRAREGVERGSDLEGLVSARVREFMLRERPYNTNT